MVDVSSYVYFVDLPRPKTGQKECTTLLLYMDSNYLSCVRILYRDVNWHGVLPFLFYFCLFFHCDAQLAAAGTRVVNIVLTP